MIKNPNQITIYDDIPYKSNLTDENILFWNKYDKNTKSILNLIEKNSSEIKKEIISELDFFHNENYKILKKIDIKIDNKVNFWSINSTIDNNNIYDQIFINDYIKFFQLKKIIKKKNINQINFFTSNEELKKKISIFKKILNIQIDIKEKKKFFKFDKSFIKKLFHPLFLALPIFLIFLFKRKKYFINSTKKKKKIRKNLFVNYFFGSNFFQGNFQSTYWGNLDNILQDNKIQRTWLHLSVPEGSSINNNEQLLNKLNRNPLSEHIMLDSYFDVKTFFRIILIWLKIILNFQKINKNLKDNIKNKFLYYLFKNNFKENIFGYKFLINLYYFYLFNIFFNNKSNFKNCFYLHENQSWERSLIYNLDYNSIKTNKFAVTHASIRFWDFRYIKLNDLNNNLKIEKFAHDKIIVASDKFKKILLDNNFNKDQIILTEVLRYEGISNLKEIILKEKHEDHIVILGDYNKKINKKIEFCISLLSKNDKYKIICKPHPLNEFKKQIYHADNLNKSNDTIKDLSKKYNNFIVPNTSSVGLELYLMGKNVITVLDDEFINYSPLKHYYNYQNYVYDINQIEQKLENDNKNYIQTDFFKQDKNLKTWIKIVNNV